MTIVAYSKGVLASDSTVTTQSGYTDGSVRKIVKTPEGLLVGAAGSLAQVSSFLDLFEDHDIDTLWSNPAWFKEYDEIEGIMIDVEGEVSIFIDGVFCDIKEEFYALGNGSPVAKGAMAMGATSEQAVEIASRFTLGCGGDIQKVEL